ncbi:11380_t:CDS:2 [Paraglomus brasilianum]|uniref:11380_t:CDS:1 n=1 Tax=Paraglomus brasilianum TaxID=144538 RepID=A0A9N9D4E6_9GLOM|nr:11380_t:CDS:2 [Paraglomus brasilianum]
MDMEKGMVGGRRQAIAATHNSTIAMAMQMPHATATTTLWLHIRRRINYDAKRILDKLRLPGIMLIAQ